MRQSLSILLLCVGTALSLKLQTGLHKAGGALVTVEENLAYINHLSKYNRVFASKSDYGNRLQTFLATRDRVKEHNTQEERSYDKGLNKFADWTHEERQIVKGGVKKDTIVAVTGDDLDSDIT